MRIDGNWHPCDDGVTRPVVFVTVRAADGAFHLEGFLVDTCADRTVLSANLLAELRISANQAPTGIALQGIGGHTVSVLVDAALEFHRQDGGTAHVRGQFSAFTDPAITDLSILGRDVLDIFDVLVSRRRNQVLLLTGNHNYSVVPA